MDEDFFLISSERFVKDEPRRCRLVRRLKYGTRDDLMLVRVTPPAKERDIGIGASETDMLVLATRHERYTLFPIMEWPCYVHCGRIIGQDVPEDGVLKKGSLDIFDWSELYQTEDEARSHQSVPLSSAQIEEGQARALEKAREVFSSERFEKLKADSERFLQRLREDDVPPETDQ